mmetsp:Transcript_40504/g.127545  ORF Transcript_40504/g.127545 Transcript_40504/m.127545 type:complete len:94 (+) Transcript_40504:285-566(+)
MWIRGGNTKMMQAPKMDPLRLAMMPSLSKTCSIFSHVATILQEAHESERHVHCHHHKRQNVLLSVKESQRRSDPSEGGEHGARRSLGRGGRQE